MQPFELPSGLKCQLREMTGVEEELLTNPKLIRKGTAINQVLLNCVVSLDGNEEPKLNHILDLLSGDRLALLVALRRISLGDDVELELTCNDPQCRHRNTATWNLEDFRAKPYAEARDFKTTLPRSQKVVHFTHLNGHMELRLAQLKDPSPSAAMLMRLTSIDGQPPNKRVMQQMSLMDRNALRQAMQEVDAGIDTSVYLDCAECGLRLTTRLEAEPGFLFPGAPF